MLKVIEVPDQFGQPEVICPWTLNVRRVTYDVDDSYCYLVYASKDNLYHDFVCLKGFDIVDDAFSFIDQLCESARIKEPEPGGDLVEL